MNIVDSVYKFYNSYEGEKGLIGYTEKQKPISYVVVKKSSRPRVIIQYSIHAREWITSYLALMQVADFKKRGRLGTVYFIPMLNVDGVKIALKQLPLYKANARGVDLNVNFDAKWSTGKTNCKIKGQENFVGKTPFSESETKALRDFTLGVNPDMTVSYHSKGEEIYWEFFQDEERRKRDYRLAKKLSETTGYELKTVTDSVGGYKDWCIQTLKIPSFTIEVGNDSLSHPLCTKHTLEIFLKNKDVVKTLTETFGRK